MPYSINNYFYQLKALIIKDLKLKTRYKVQYLFSILTPLFTFIIPYLIFMKLFEAIGDKSFGIWTPHNFIIFVLTGLFVIFIFRLIEAYGKILLFEKYYKTLSGLLISPITITSFLMSILISELIVLAIPLILILSLCFFIAKASFFTILFITFLFFLACLLLASIGLALGVFKLSVEGRFAVLIFFFKFLLIFSCYKYPIEFFPDFLKFFIIFNPFYYYWDLIRYIFVFGIEFVIFNPDFMVHFIIIFILTIIAPILSIYIFKYTFKKYGISGY